METSISHRSKKTNNKDTIYNPDHIQLPQVSKCEGELNPKKLQPYKEMDHYEKVSKYKRIISMLIKSLE